MEYLKFISDIIYCMISGEKNIFFGSNLLLLFSSNDYKDILESSSISLKDFLESIESSVNILSSIITGVILILGSIFLKNFKEKKDDATFAFWSQFKVRIMRLYRYLCDDKSLLNNMYTKDARKIWEETSPSAETLNLFFDIIEETLQFLEECDNQMPAYNGWSDDYSVLLNFLLNAKQYNIKDGEKKFLSDSDNVADRNNYYKEICNAMKNLIDGINWRQSAIEKRLYRNKNSYISTDINGGENSN